MPGEGYMRKLWLTLLLWGVFSPCWAANWATEWTQILNNIQLLNQTKNQIEGLYNDAEMIRNQIESLKSIASYKGNWNDLNQILLQIESIRQRNEAAWNSVQGAYRRARELFPEIDKEQDYKKSLETLNAPVLSAADGAIAITEDQEARTAKEQEAVRNLLQKSDEAVGQTQALQTMNQLMAELIRQMQELRALNEWQLAQKSAEAKKTIELENKEQKDMQEVFHDYEGASSQFSLKEGF